MDESATTSRTMPTMNWWILSA
uniref:Uncharacterized protein n=1 Tax=Anguilla anguilla TaxID=7936 RepID=A0A0E9RW53_ANGAN